MLLGDTDLLDYLVAQRLGQPLHVVRSWPALELEEWRSYLAVERWERERHG